MIKQARIIKEFCKREGFNFVDCDKNNRKVPCALDKNYIIDNQTIFIKGFIKRSKKIYLSRGGMKIDTDIRVPIDTINDNKWFKENILHQQWTCDKCKKKNLNLRTQDNHKTYDCPECQKTSNRKEKKK